eukprot:CAMPEP_0194441770 /NCGR_PEP_ID=MMETSP0176-20130528/123367_1 /TAXON_ID=216777 /ORGANISM="Proboscia alata, Strain PI-D3" /LENGTH=82 /DNA_ID=CAMNT_0039267411 /DNA_START=10 /DNA_END=254 /DNA_ORIENTATION=-
MVVLMVSTGYSCAEEARQLKENTAYQPVPLVRVEGLQQMLPILVFATMYHYSIPGLSAPVADKTQLGLIFRATGVFSGLAYA